MELTWTSQAIVETKEHLLAADQEESMDTLLILTELLCVSQEPTAVVRLPNGEVNWMDSWRIWSLIPSDFHALLHRAIDCRHFPISSTQEETGIFSEEMELSYAAYVLQRVIPQFR